MAQHGYLGDGFGAHGEIDPDRDDDRDRGRKERDRDWRDRDRGLMFGDRQQDQYRDDDPRSERYRRDEGYGGFRSHYRGGREQDRFEDRGSYSEGRRRYSSNPDDHYRSWRDRQMQALDRDYEDYCREREQQFHRDFDSWRNQRHGNPEPLRTGMTQTGLSHDPTGEMQLTEDAALDPQNTTDPMGTATLGTTSGGGRRK